LTNRERYELRIERLDGGDLRHNPGDLIEFFDLDDDTEAENVLSKHFVPLACAADGHNVEDDVEDMPWLAAYVLRVYEPDDRNPVLAYRGWRE
jgi:hypothetical protein